MSYMFLLADVFNQPIGAIDGWDVSNVTQMDGMFKNAVAFNKDISKWNVSKVTDMWNMFRGATAFNQPIGNWDVSNVTYMAGMFYDAKNFCQDLSSWGTRISRATITTDMFSGTGFGKATCSHSIPDWY